ncbi:hypothetical protein NZK27_03055 [Synechococcus sp. FGCU-3]|nr:hypothetical protein [Synechococcus sp. FGCU3]
MRTSDATEVSAELQQRCGCSDLWLRRQSRRGSTHLLLVGVIDGVRVSKRVAGADPAHPRLALPAALELAREIRANRATRPPEPEAVGAWRRIELRALQSIREEQEAHLLRPGTAACRERWVRRAVRFLMDRGWPVSQANLHIWVTQSPQGSRERRERLTAARGLAAAAGFAFAASSEARFCRRGQPPPEISQVLTRDDQAAVETFRRLLAVDPSTAWPVAMGLATGARLMGVMAMHPADLAQLASSGAPIGDSVRYWDSKQGRRKINRAIISLDLSSDLCLGSVSQEFLEVLMPWNRPANPDEHERARLAAARVHQRLRVICGPDARHLGARWLRHLACMRLLRSGMPPVQVAAAISTSLPRLEERYGQFFPHGASGTESRQRPRPDD